MSKHWIPAPVRPLVSRAFAVVEGLGRADRRRDRRGDAVDRREVPRAGDGRRAELPGDLVHPETPPPPRTGATRSSTRAASWRSRACGRWRRPSRSCRTGMTGTIAGRFMPAELEGEVAAMPGWRARAVPRPGAPGGDRARDGRRAGRHRPQPPAAELPRGVVDEDVRVHGARAAGRVLELPAVGRDRGRRRLRDRRRSARPGRRSRTRSAASTRTRRSPGGWARTAGGRSPSATTGRRSSSSSRRCTAGSRDAAGRGPRGVRARASLRPRRRPRRLARARLDAARARSAATSASAGPTSPTARACASPTCSSRPRARTG